MKFYGREKERATLLEIREQSRSTATMTVLVGRRRIGKTALLLNTFGGSEDFVYLFTSRTSEALLCQSFQRTIESAIGQKFLGQSTKISDLMTQLFVYSSDHPITVVIDEFQEFEYINPSLFGEFQFLWDTYHNSAKINLILCGSVYSMMRRIFEDYKEPLFGRLTHKINLRPFRIGELKEILSQYNPDYTSEDLLFLYSLTGCVPMYVASLMDQGATTKKAMVEAFCAVGSRFLDEAPEMLIGEFGKQYTNYFSILQLIASGMTTQKEIDSVLEKSSGAYMQILEQEYSLIRRNQPFGSKPGGRILRWQLDDNFLMFWFRFVAPNRHLIASGNNDGLRLAIESGYPQFSGIMLERYFRQKISEERPVDQIGSWWDRKGENEVDLIAVSRLEKWVMIAEVKRNSEKIDYALLRKKVAALHPVLPRYKQQIVGLSMADM